MQQPDRLSWFAGDRDALDLYERLVFVSHSWDDLIDKDKPVSSATINDLVANLILYLPGNPFFRKHEEAMRAGILAAMTGYRAANIMERSGDEHKIELAHYVRYSVVNLVMFMLGVIHGSERGAEMLADILPLMIPERVGDYLKEHNNAQT